MDKSTKRTSVALYIVMFGLLVMVIISIPGINKDTDGKIVSGAHTKINKDVDGNIISYTDSVTGKQIGPRIQSTNPSLAILLLQLSSGIYGQILDNINVVIGINDTVVTPQQLQQQLNSYNITK